MIEQQARVFRVHQLTALVRIGAQSGCSVCDAGEGCGAGLFGKLLRRNPLELELKNSLDAREGQAVVIGIPESQFIKLVAMLYGWPLIAGLVGTALAHQSAVSMGWSAGWVDFLAIAGGLLAAFAVLKIWTLISKPDISSADIRLMESKHAFSACDIPVAAHQIIEKEV